MPDPIRSTRDRLYPPTRIATLVKLLVDDVPVDEALRGTGLSGHALDDPSCTTSIDQYLRVCENALESHDGAIALRSGARSRLSDHGLYGLLWQSSASVRDCFDTAVKYQALAAPTMAIEWSESDSHASWVWHDDAFGDRSGGLRRFVVEQQVAQLVAHLDEALGAPCWPSLACFTHPAPAHHALYGGFFHCPVIFGWHRNELRYPREILRQRPCLANPLAVTTLQAACDALIVELDAALGFAGKVHSALRSMHDPGAGMKDVAAAMNMTDRTLRRRLADEGTSFSTISHRLRCAVASEHLSGSRASIEQVATIAGFSDLANFRRAFIRWTNMTPAQFRRSRRRPDAVGAHRNAVASTHEDQLTQANDAATLTSPVPRYCGHFG